MIRLDRVVLSLSVLLLAVSHAQAQTSYTDVIPGVKTGGSRNVRVLSHVPLDSTQKTADITMEQELSRPYVYTAHRLKPSGVDIITIKDPARPRILWSWRIENAELHQGAGSLNPMYLKSKGRYYLTDTFQFSQGGPDVDLCAVVWDVTGLPDTSKIKELARVHIPESPGGCHESYSYKHSNGEALLFTSTQSAYANIYDIDQVVVGGKNGQAGLVGRVPIPDTTNGGSLRAYHDFYVAYDLANKRDVFYGAGVGGYFVYDVTDVANPKLLTSITGMAGVTRGHTFQVEPSGRYGVLETEYQYAPLRMVDLKPGLDGTVKTISRPIGAWTADWRDLSHNFEIRWPYVFTSAYEDGLQVFNMMDPTNPYTVGYFYTCECPHEKGVEVAPGVGSVMNGAWGVQVRNADGLIVISDLTTGFWAFKMDGFDGWNGHQWGLPNVSSAQDWDHGPEGAPPPRKVS